jgi:hypothetical protein
MHRVSDRAAPQCVRHAVPTFTIVVLGKDNNARPSNTATTQLLTQHGGCGMLTVTDR